MCADNHFGAYCLPCELCQRHGSCTPGIAGRCDCHPGYAGESCNLCAENHYSLSCTPCPNCTVAGPEAGHCYDGLGGNGTCGCNPGYFGMNCEDYTCEAVGCSGHGVCTVSENGTYVCVCNVGYYGEFCELRQVCLVSGDCENGGTCETLGDGSSRCVCEPGYNGTYCEEAFGCRSEAGACQNGGVCNPSTSDPSDVQCYCTRDYTGPTCAEPLGDGINVVTAIVVPLAVLATALILFLLASAHARRTGNRDANNVVVIKVVLALFDLMTDAIFVYAAWVDGGRTVPWAVAVASTVFLAVPFLLNIVLSTSFLSQQLAKTAMRGPEAYAWFSSASHEAGVALAWVLSLSNIDVLQVLSSGIFRWSWCQAPWSDDTAAARWLKVASLVTVLLEDIPQVTIQIYLIAYGTGSSVSVVAATSSMIMQLHAILERTAIGLVQRYAPATRLYSEIGDGPRGDPSRIDYVVVN